MTDSDHPDRTPSGIVYPKDQNFESGTRDEFQRGDEAQSAQPGEKPSFSIVVDDQAGAFVAREDGVDFGAVPFVEKDGRVVLLATSILPEYRGRGLATELIRRVLDKIHAEGKRATVRCPVFRSFIERNPEYEALLDPVDPGIVRRDDV